MPDLLEALLHGEVPSSLLVPRDLPRLTDRQEQVLAFIAAYIDKEGVSPSMRKVGRRFGWSGINSVATHYRFIRAKGYIDWRPNEILGVRLTDRGRWWWSQKREASA